MCHSNRTIPVQFPERPSHSRYRRKRRLLQQRLQVLSRQALGSDGAYNGAGACALNGPLRLKRASMVSSASDPTVIVLWRSCGWYFETRRFLKGGSRVIAMADYKAEKALVLAVPHRVLLGDHERLTDDPQPKSRPIARSRRPQGCPF